MDSTPVEIMTWENIVAEAERLGVEPCAIQAVYEAESVGTGFLPPEAGLPPPGRPTIRFEGHIFWRELLKRNLDPRQWGTSHPTVLYPKWTKEHYRKNPNEEYQRLAEARAIHQEAALGSASWGAFQIMGFNFAACGYGSVHEFVHAQESAAGQLRAFCEFIKNANLVKFLKDKNWKAFAAKYNGPGYASNNYDVKLANAYAKCHSQHSL